MSIEQSSERRFDAPGARFEIREPAVYLVRPAVPIVVHDFLSPLPAGGAGPRRYARGCDIEASIFRVPN